MGQEVSRRHQFLNADSIFLPWPVHVGFFDGQTGIGSLHIVHSVHCR